MSLHESRPATRAASVDLSPFAGFGDSPEAVGVRRLPMHSLRRRPALDLDAGWQFQLCATAQEAPTDRWESVDLPFLWTIGNSSDRPHYTNLDMPFALVPPAVPHANPTGYFVKEFEWSSTPGERVVLHVGAAEGALFVALNDVFIGASKDSHLAAEFDATGAIRDGLNVLVLKVVKWSDASYLEDQDQWWHAGISRSVFLYRTGRVHIADIDVTTDYDPAIGTGLFELSAHTGGLGIGEAGWTYQFHLELDEPLHLTTEVTPVAPLKSGPVFEPQDRSVRGEPTRPEEEGLLWSLQAAGAPVPAQLEAHKIVGSHFPDQHGTARVGTTQVSVEAWSAEQPRLYGLRVNLISPEGAVADTTNLRVGFRRVEIQGRDLLINGARILFQGVNRHDHDPRTGRAVSRELMRHELALLKQFNFNSIRTSHYPNDPYLLELCDEYGIYVVNEADIEAHAWYTRASTDPQYLGAFVDRVSRMVVRDKNHPSVYCWSLGNESGYGPNHEAAAAWVRSYDRTRVVQYEGAISEDWFAGASTTDIVCPMYPAFEALTWYAKSPRGTRPLILCEYAYSQGNSTGGLADYWDIFENTPGLQGGYIWEFKDHGLDPDGDGRLRHGDDFGTAPNDNVVILNGIVDSDGNPRPAMYEARGIFSPVRIVSTSADAKEGAIRLKNRLHFGDLSAYEFSLVLVDRHGEHVFPIARVIISPSSEAELALPPAARHLLRDNQTLGFRLEVRTRTHRAWADAGTPIALHSLVLRTPPFETSGSTQLTVVSPLEHPLLKRAPELCLWRALTDNDASPPLDHRFIRSGLFELREESRDVTLVGPQEQRVIRTLISAFGERITHTRTIHHLGEADWRLQEQVDVPEAIGDVLRIGMEFELIAGFADASWLGLGPWENYPDRSRSAAFGHWKSSIESLSTPYLRPQENGNRGGTFTTRFRHTSGRSVSTQHSSGMHFSASRHTATQLERSSHWWQLPASDITVVHIDIAQRGVGTGWLGPDTLPTYRVTGGRYEWEWRLTIHDND